MTLVFRIFEPDKRQIKTLSERLSSYSFRILIVCGLFYLLFEKVLSLRIPNLLYATLICLTLALHIAALIIRLTEFESVNGVFSGSFKLGENAIECDNFSYPYKEMSDFQLKVVDFYGAPTHNSRYGPAYKNGTSNSLSFVISGETKEFYFEIKTEYFITAIYYHLIDIICNEKLPFQEEYLNLIPKKHKTFVVYRDFVARLKAEKRI